MLLKTKEVPPLAVRKPLNQMTRTEARIAIAQDVLDQIAAKNIMAKSGFYAVPLDLTEREAYSTTAKCVVCALGSMFVCGLSTPDDVNPERLRLVIGDVQANMHKALKPYFGEDELRLIETAFERDIGFMKRNNNNNNNNNYPNSLIDRAVAFRDGPDRQSDEKALKAIMENIVANNGEFIP